MGVDGLLERDAELQRIADALGRLGDGAGEVVVVEGAAGVGKTELVRAAVSRARDRGIRALSGHGIELERDFPFGVARQMFSPLVRGRSSDAGDRFTGAAGLVRPLLDGSLRASSGDGEFPFLHGFFWLVGNLTESTPVVLALDDAHWSDAPSLRALLYLMQRLEELPVAVVVAIRDGEPGSGARLLAEFKAHPRASRLRPAPLTRDAVERLVRARLATAEQPFVDACGEVTGGNPFLLGELLSAVEARSVPATAAGAMRVREMVPRQVLDTTLMRLARLGPDATALARALAVLGDRAELRTLAAIAGVAPAAATIAADALATAWLVRQQPSLSFAHPLLQSAIYAGIGPTERARMHATAARVLASAGGESTLVAAQLVPAERAADPWVVGELRRAAGMALAAGAPASAGRYLKRALEEPAPPALHAELVAELASAEALAGEPVAAEDLGRAIEAMEDPRQRVRLRITLAEVLDYQGRQLEAAALLDAGREEAERVDREIALELEAAFIGVARLEPSLRARAMPRLAELSRDLAGDTPIERVLLAHEANRRAFEGDPHVTVRELVHRAWADGALLEGERRAGFAPITAVAALGWCDDFDANEAYASAMQADARRRGLVLAYADATYALHLSHHFRGRLADAMADVEGAIDARRYGWKRHLATATSQLVWTLIELGELDRAACALEDPELEEMRGRLPYALVHDARGRLAIARGDMRTALQEFLAAGRIAESAPIANPSYLPWRSSAAVACSRQGERVRARELVNEELRRAERFGAPRPLGVALRAAGLVEGGDDGVQLLREAVARLADSPAGLEHARALTDLGGALRRRGHRRDARPPLRAALELAIGFGATAIERRARDELVAAGARPRRRQFSGVDALTPSERRVAEMAARGMSNREIAETLFVTVKAVQWHLGNSYRKIGISSREELGPRVLGGLQ